MISNSFFPYLELRWVNIYDTSSALRSCRRAVVAIKSCILYSRLIPVVLHSPPTFSFPLFTRCHFRISHSRFLPIAPMTDIVRHRRRRPRQQTRAVDYIVMTSRRQCRDNDDVMKTSRRRQRRSRRPRRHDADDVVSSSSMRPRRRRSVRNREVLLEGSLIPGAAVRMLQGSRFWNHPDPLAFARTTLTLLYQCH